MWKYIKQKTLKREEKLMKLEKFTSGKGTLRKGGEKKRLLNSLKRITSRGDRETSLFAISCFKCQRDVILGSFVFLFLG